MSANKKPTKSRLHVTTLGCRINFFYQAQRYSFCGNYTNFTTRTIKVKPYKTAKRVKAKTLSSERQQSQLKRVVDCFAEHPRTMLDVALTTGIFRANICRYVAKLRNAGRIQIHHYGIDAVTKSPAGFLTTNPAMFISPMSNQSKTEG